MSTQTLEQEVLRAEEARCKATRDGDLQALRELLHESYTHVTGHGSVMNREQYVDWVRETPRRHERHDLQVRCYGDSAIIVGGLTNHITAADGGTRVIQTMVTQVAHREHGSWRFVAFQITPKR